MVAFRVFFIVFKTMTNIIALKNIIIYLLGRSSSNNSFQNFPIVYPKSVNFGSSVLLAEFVEFARFLAFSEAFLRF